MSHSTSKTVENHRTLWGLGTFFFKALFGSCLGIFRNPAVSGRFQKARSRRAIRPKAKKSAATRLGLGTIIGKFGRVSPIILEIFPYNLGVSPKSQG